VTPGSRDEAYVLDLCDQLLGHAAFRQHRFDFLRGDRGHRLPVDAYYPSLNLVIEYREIQHTQPVAIMDRRMTVSGVARGEQRRLYDERRRIVLAEQGLQLIELDYSLFEVDGRQRIRRDAAAAVAVLRRALAHHLPDPS